MDNFHQLRKQLSGGLATDFAVSTDPLFALRLDPNSRLLHPNQTDGYLTHRHRAAQADVTCINAYAQKPLRRPVNY
jgi:hypothetical protein